MTRSDRHIPPDEWRLSRIAKVNAAFDLLVEGPQTGQELAKHLDVTVTTAQRVVHDLRLTLGNNDTITVMTNHQGRPNEPHLYELVGNYEDSIQWRKGRISDIEARLVTAEYSIMPIARGADGRTVEGKKAAKIERTLRYLREELAAMDG